jgi:hypothetical protein
MTCKNCSSQLPYGRRVHRCHLEHLLAVSANEQDMKYELTDALDRAQLSPELMDTITQ